MLLHLSIQNIALVERADLSLGEGLNVLTGETGAGKSALIGALSLVLGGRASADTVRAGADEGIVESLFEVQESSVLNQRLVERGIDIRDEQLLVRRVASARPSARRVLLNGQMATVGMLGDILRGSVDLTSQHEHVSLLDTSTHLDMVDLNGDLMKQRERISAVHAEVLGYRAALEALQIDEAEKAQREDYLSFALEEIEAIAPDPDELEKLATERKRLKNAAELIGGVRRAEATLYSEDGAAVERIGRVERELLRLSHMDKGLSEAAQAASGVIAEISDLAHELSRYLGTLPSDPARLAEVDDRVEQVKRLIRKYGNSVEDVLTAEEQMKEELQNLTQDEARRADLTLALEEKEKEEQELAARLSSSRNRSARTLQKKVEAELAELSMAGTKIAVRLTPLETIGAKGAETAEILFASGASEPLRPMRRIASGGELSRILLASKNVLCDEQLATYIFDEIDSGIGGAVAEVLGAKLKDLAEKTQVVCITHLPQVAAYADTHFRVHKSSSRNRPVTSVESLDSEKARVEELARMLGGVRITKRTRDLARELRGRGASEARSSRSERS